MPELPDITVYAEALERFIVGKRLVSVAVRSPAVLKTFDPPISDCEGTCVEHIGRSGKRIIWELSADLFLVFHLMIAGRFHWKKTGTRPTRKVDLAAFSFEHGTLLLTEASQMKRATLHVHRGKDALLQHDRDGLNVLTCSPDEFRDRLRHQNRTLKKALTDPSLFDGIGNAYSDEILYAARLSPVQLTSRLTDEKIVALFDAVQTTLTTWIERLRTQVGERFPEKVTAFHPDMSVHGRFGQPCRDCGAKIQRVVFSDREFNYCPGCQTDGKILRDRLLSRLLNDDWPGSLDR